MITFDRAGSHFTYRVAGVAVHDGRVLLLHAVREDIWYLPGGRCEIGEAAEEALRREMREELGAEVGIGRLLWVVENFFTWIDGRPCHELGLYFQLEVPPSVAGRDGEFATLEGEPCRWHPLAHVDGVRVRPAFLRHTLRALPPTTQHIVNRDGATPPGHPAR